MRFVRACSTAFSAMRCGLLHFLKLYAIGKKGATAVESQLGTYAWYNQNSGNKTHEVKKKSPNAYGLYDMSGNVFEWCFDRHGNIENGDVSDPQGAASGARRVERGGWKLGAKGCVVGVRVHSTTHNHLNYVGFRVACRP